MAETPAPRAPRALALRPIGLTRERAGDVPFGHESFQLGRTVPALCLPPEEQSVSRQHCTIIQLKDQPETAMLRVQHRNGVLVHRAGCATVEHLQPADKTQGVSTVLNLGDTLTIGPWVKGSLPRTEAGYAYELVDQARSLPVAREPPAAVRGSMETPLLAGSTPQTDARLGGERAHDDTPTSPVRPMANFNATLGLTQSPTNPKPATPPRRADAHGRLSRTPSAVETAAAAVQVVAETAAAAVQAAPAAIETAAAAVQAAPAAIETAAAAVQAVPAAVQTVELAVQAAAAATETAEAAVQAVADALDAGTLAAVETAECGTLAAPQTIDPAAGPAAAEAEEAEMVDAAQPSAAPPGGTKRGADALEEEDGAAEQRATRPRADAACSPPPRAAADDARGATGAPSCEPPPSPTPTDEASFLAAISKQIELEKKHLEKRGELERKLALFRKRHEALVDRMSAYIRGRLEEAWSEFDNSLEPPDDYECEQCEETDSEQDEDEDDYRYGRYGRNWRHESRKRASRSCDCWKEVDEYADFSELAEELGDLLDEIQAALHDGRHAGALTSALEGGAAALKLGAPSLVTFDDIFDAESEVESAPAPAWTVEHCRAALCALIAISSQLEQLCAKLPPEASGDTAQLEQLGEKLYPQFVALAAFAETHKVVRELGFKWRALWPVPRSKSLERCSSILRSARKLAADAPSGASPAGRDGRKAWSPVIHATLKGVLKELDHVCQYARTDSAFRQGAFGAQLKGLVAELLQYGAGSKAWRTAFEWALSKAEKLGQLGSAPAAGTAQPAATGKIQRKARCGAHLLCAMLDAAIGGSAPADGADAAGSALAVRGLELCLVNVAIAREVQVQAQVVPQARVMRLAQAQTQGQLVPQAHVVAQAQHADARIADALRRRIEMSSGPQSLLELLGRVKSAAGPGPQQGGAIVGAHLGVVVGLVRGILRTPGIDPSESARLGLDVLAIAHDFAALRTTEVRDRLDEAAAAFADALRVAGPGSPEWGVAKQQLASKHADLVPKACALAVAELGKLRGSRYLLEWHFKPMLPLVGMCMAPLGGAHRFLLRAAAALGCERREMATDLVGMADELLKAVREALVPRVLRGVLASKGRRCPRGRPSCLCLVSSAGHALLWCSRAAALVGGGQLALKAAIQAELAKQAGQLKMPELVDVAEKALQRYLQIGPATAAPSVEFGAWAGFKQSALDVRALPPPTSGCSAERAGACARELAAFDAAALGTPDAPCGPWLHAVQAGLAGLANEHLYLFGAAELADHCADEQVDCETLLQFDAADLRDAVEKSGADCARLQQRALLLRLARARALLESEPPPPPAAAAAPGPPPAAPRPAKESVSAAVAWLSRAAGAQLTRVPSAIYLCAPLALFASLSDEEVDAELCRPNALNAAQAAELLSALRPLREAERRAAALKPGAPRPELWPRLVEAGGSEEGGAAASTTFVVCGGTGAGKSTLLNALLGEVSLLPTSCMRACTAAIIEIAFRARARCDAELYQARVRFCTAEQLGEDVRAVVQAGGKEPADDAPAAAKERHARVLSLFGGAFDASAGERALVASVEARLSALGAALGHTLTLHARDSAELSRLLQPFADSSDDTCTGQSVWPLLHAIELQGPWPVLGTGMRLVDAPGLHDDNSARDAAVRHYIERADGVIFVSHCARALNDKDTHDMMPLGFKRQLVREGLRGDVLIIATKADEMAPEEIARNLKMDESTPARALAAARRAFLQRTITDGFYQGVAVDELPVNRPRAAAAAPAAAAAAAASAAAAEPSQPPQPPVPLRAEAEAEAERFELPVFVTSAADYQRMIGVRCGDGETSGLFDTLEETDMPALARMLQHRVAAAAREASASRVAPAGSAAARATRVRAGARLLEHRSAALAAAEQAPTAGPSAQQPQQPQQPQPQPSAPPPRVGPAPARGATRGASGTGAVAVQRLTPNQTAAAAVARAAADAAAVARAAADATAVARAAADAAAASAAARLRQTQQAAARRYAGAAGASQPPQKKQKQTPPGGARQPAHPPTTPARTAAANGGGGARPAGSNGPNGGRSGSSDVIDLTLD